jgi:hypothetical protein
MSISRTEYFKDLLTDCFEAIREQDVAPEDEAVLVAALIQSDSYNGIRKALTQAQGLRYVPQLHRASGDAA